MRSLTQETAKTRLCRMLESGIEAAATFMEYLAAERTALEEMDGAALENAAAGKHGTLQTLEVLEKERIALLIHGGFRDDSDGMQALSDWCEDDGVLSGQWQRYLAVAKECQQANLTNGAIVRLRHQQIAGALAALSGSSPQTYGPSGSNDNSGSRALAKA